MTNHLTPHVSALFVLTLSLTGCGPSAEVPHADVEACEHLQKGPADSVTAATAQPPPVSNDHKRYDIALVDVDGGKGGNVTFAAPEAVDYAFFFDRSIPVRFTREGATAAPEASTLSSPGCAEVKTKLTVPLSVGTYTLELGPTSETQVRLVVEEAAGHSEHE